MQRFLILGAVALVAGSMGVTRVATMEGDLQRLEEFSRINPQRTSVLETELLSLQTDLVRAVDEVHDLRESGGNQDGVLRRRVASLEASLLRATDRLETQSNALFALEQSPQTVQQRLSTFEEDLQMRAQATEARLAATQDQFERLTNLVGDEASSADVDVAERWQDIVAPTVQLSGETTVGSGVLLSSRYLGKGAGYETLLVTSWHVVRDILADAGSDEAPVPVAIFDVAGNVRSLTASLLCREVAMDAALLRLNTRKQLDHGATLATRENLDSRRVFHNLYAVGCPLGNDPIPTRGEIADLTHVVDGTSYWMISAPTYIGNSGGGIYDAENGRLMGLFSKIYTHGSVRPTVVPHMGLVTPLGPFYDWLEETGNAQVVEGPDGTVLIPQ
ncbi:MAG: hypothetical protein ACI8QC_001535 [Planctomycetota bacterium]|jgi:hypothetical protein